MDLKDRIVISVGIILFAAVMISLLLIYSSQRKPALNGFQRIYRVQKAGLIKAISLPYAVRSIAGVSSTNIYLETDSANNLVCTNTQLASFEQISIPFVNSDSIQSLFKIIVDSPFITIAAGNVPAVIESRLHAPVVSVHQFPTHTFTRLDVMGKNNYVMRMFNKSSKNWDQLFVKGNTITGAITKEKDLSEQQGDGGFSTDGLLHYDAYSALILYNYFYENKLHCFDTSLKLKYKINTIDNITRDVTRGGTLLKGDNNNHQCQPGTGYTLSELYR